MARIVVAGAGATGASVAFHLASLGARDVVLADKGRVAGGATAKAMGGVRQQFSTAAEVRLAQASIRFFEELGPPLFDQVGYLFVATTEEGLAALEERRALQEELGVPVEHVDPSYVEGLRTDDVLGAVVCSTDGTADPPAVTRELVRRATKLGVEVREGCDATTLEADTLVIACGPWSAEVGARRAASSCRCARSAASCSRPASSSCPTTCRWCSRPRAASTSAAAATRLVLAMTDPEPRWGFDEVVDETLFDDRLERLRHRYPAAAEATIEDAWAGLYDMTPDAHPILGEVADGVYAACGFSGHGFMQSPAVGRALAEEILGESPSLDLGPYRLSRFEERRRLPRDASPLARTPRRPRGPCRSARALRDRLVVSGERDQAEALARVGSEIQRSPSGSSGSFARSSSSVVIESARFQSRAEPSLVGHAGRRQLRDQLLDLPQHVGFLVPEVVEVGVQRGAQQPQLVVGQLQRVVQNGPLGS